MKSRSIALDPVLGLVCLAIVTGGCSHPGIVKSVKKTATNEYHGVKVTDDYQWLENAADPSVRTWTAQQNVGTRAALDKLPEHALIEQRLQQLNSGESVNYSGLQWHGGKLFALKFQPPAQQPVLVRLDSATTTNDDKVVLDLNKLGEAGSTSMDFYEVSPDGKTLAAALSQHGSEDGTLHFFDVETGRELPDQIPAVQYPTAGGSVAWNSQSTGVFYTRYPRPGERPEADQHFYQQVFFHQLGTPVALDRYEIGKEFPRIAEIDLKSSSDGRWLVAAVANGDGGDFEHHLRAPDGKWRQIAKLEDGVKQIEFGRDPIYIEQGKDLSLYLLSLKGAPRGRILRVPLGNPDLAKAQEIIKEGKWPIQDFKPAAGGLYVAELEGGPSKMRFYDFFEKKDQPLDFKKPTAVEQILVTRGDEVLVRTATYTEPYVWSLYDPNKDKNRIEATQLHGFSPVSFNDIEAVRVSAKSAAGTNVPMTILRRRGTRLDGESPTILTGYGGYGISLKPNFDVNRRVWFDQGGIIAVANLRGGGELGDDWHKAGALTNKQNVFDDFAACARHLIETKHTRPGKLAIQGGSNGGLLMGALLTQHPYLARAVVSHVGIYDMLRVELDPNGAFNVTEFGTVKDAAQFRALYAYSPYHRVTDGVKYPAVLLLTGEKDGRVNPAHSRKMTARLQAATGSGLPVLLRTSAKSGHGIGTAFSEKIATLADVYAFLCDQLGVPFTVIERGPWSGGITPTTAVVKAKLNDEGMKARLVVSEKKTLESPRYFGPLDTVSSNASIAAFEARRLKPDTQYYYALEVDGRLDRARPGEFKTFPPADQPASFTFAWASCGKTASTNGSYDLIREKRPLIYLNCGDFHYLDINTNNLATFRAAYDTVLASVQQGDLYRTIPFDYVWDDHDFGGNNVTKKSSTKPAASMAYQEYVPHYPLAEGTGVLSPYHSFAIGRVKFIVTDLRSERDDDKKKDDENKSMMGAQQKAWFKQQLLASNGRYPLIVWVSSVPWLGGMNTNYYPIATNAYGFIHHTNLVDLYKKTNRPSADQEHWCAYATERREMADFIKSNHISGVAIVHGDSHMLAADDGTNGDFATGGGAPIPVMCGGPLDQNPSLKGGPYSQGVYRVRQGEGCFGLLNIEDQGDRIAVHYSGINNKNEEKITLKFSVPARAPAGGSKP